MRLGHLRETAAALFLAQALGPTRAEQPEIKRSATDRISAEAKTTYGISKQPPRNTLPAAHTSAQIPEPWRSNQILSGENVGGLTIGGACDCAPKLPWSGRAEPEARSEIETAPIAWVCGALCAETAGTKGACI